MLGTFVLIVFGTASVAQKVLSDGGRRLGPLDPPLVGPRRDDGHLRLGGRLRRPPQPRRHARPRRVSRLPVAQGRAATCSRRPSGAFAGAAVTFLTYREAFDHFDGGVRQVSGRLATAGIFATYPQPFLSAFPGGFVDQVVGTALLLLGIFALARPEERGADDARPRPRGRARRRHRHDVRLQRRLRDQPGPRPRTAPLHVPRRAGGATSSGPAAAGGGCRSWRPASAASWAASSTTR